MRVCWWWWWWWCMGICEDTWRQIQSHIRKRQRQKVRKQRRRIDCPHHSTAVQLFQTVSEHLRRDELHVKYCRLDRTSEQRHWHLPNDVNHPKLTFTYVYTVEFCKSKEPIKVLKSSLFCLSKQLHFYCGVPQGSSLGPSSLSYMHL